MTPEPTVIVIEGTKGEQGEKGEQGNLGVALPSGTALFETSLQAPITSTAVTMTVRANSVSGGNTLTGYQCFTIDEGSAQAEFVCGTISGTTISSMTRGVDPITATSTNSALQFAHRRGANVKITDFPLIQVMRNIINGGESFPNALTFDGKLTYSSAPSITGTLDIITKDYADAIANQGAATATEAVGGIVELATAIEAASSTDNGVTRPMVLQSKYATTSPDTTTSPLIVMAEVGGKIKQAWLNLTEAFTWTGAHIFSSNVTIGGTLGVTGTSTLATTTISKLTVSTPVAGTDATNKTYVDGIFIGASASDSLQESADTERTKTEDGSTWEKKKEIVAPLTGIYRVKFDLKQSLQGAGGYSSAGRVYRNGTGIGTIRESSANSYVTYSEDLYYNTSDLIQVYVQAQYSGSGGGANTVNIENFRIYFDYGSIAIGDLNMTTFKTD